MESSQLVLLRNNIEKLDKIHQLYILSIFKNANVDYTENANGIFVNMTILDSGTISDIKSYIAYVKLQQTQLNKVEADKEMYKKQFYKDNKASLSYN